MSYGKCCFPDSNTILNYVTHCLCFMTDAVRDWESYDIHRCFEMQWSTCRTHGLLWFWHDAIRRWFSSLQWRHNDHDGVSNHQPYGCLLNRLFRRRSKKTSKLRVTGLCVGTGEFPAQRASYAENISIWWRHHVVSWKFYGALAAGILAYDKHQSAQLSGGCRCWQQIRMYISGISLIKGIYISKYRVQFGTASE